MLELLSRADPSKSLALALLATEIIVARIFNSLNVGIDVRKAI